jgi:hypothetical protein
MDVTIHRLLVLWAFMTIMLGQVNAQDSNRSFSEEDALFAFVETDARKNNNSPISLKPPLLLNPVFQPKTGGINFSWENSQTIPIQVEYIIKIYKDSKKDSKSRKPIFEVKTTEMKFEFQDASTYLVVGNKYEVSISAQEQSDEYSFSNNGISSPVSFFYIPDCPLPIYPKVDSYGEQGISISWFEPHNALGDYYYILRYSEMSLSDKSTKHTEKRILDGTNYEITKVNKGHAYYIQLQRVCQEGNERLNSGWADVGYVTIKGDDEKGGGDKDCDKLTDIAIKNIGATYATISWEGPSESSIDDQVYDINYVIRYRTTNPQGVWTEITVFNGNSFVVEDLEENTEYEFEIKLVIPELEVACEWQPAGVITTTNDDTDPPTPPNDDGGQPDIKLPEFFCGDDFTVPDVSNAVRLAQAAPGDVFYVGGFPMLLDTVSGGDGNFSGSGQVPLPFSDETVAVSFNNIKVNSDSQVWQGTVEGISDDPANYPNFDATPIVLGSQDICQPPPAQAGFDANGNWQPGNLPYNPQGFDVSGNYANPPCDSTEAGVSCSPLHDPNGFDAQGNHVETGTPYNPAGCDQNGLDANGQLCTPSGECAYYWLVDCNSTPTAAGSAFADQMDAQIRPLIQQALNEFLASANDSIDLHRGRCDLIRQEIEMLIGTLGYDEKRALAFGENDLFLNEDMNEHYTTKPVERETSTDLIDGQEDLEFKNIQLYECDVLVKIYKDLKKIIEKQQEQDKIDANATVLLNLIGLFDTTKVNYYTANPDSLFIWVKDNMGTIVINIYESQFGPLSDNTLQNVNGLASRGIIPTNRRKYHQQLQSNIKKERYAPQHAYNYVASIGGNPALNQALIESFELTPDDMSFQFRQGWEYIGDVHRAYYLRELSKYQSLTTVNGQGGGKMPVRLEKQVFGRNYIIYLDNIVFTPAGANLDAYFLLEIPSSGTDMVFRALDLSFGPTGVKVDSQLELANDVEIRLSNSAKLIILGSENTHVAWDCDGFAGMGIDAEIEFCRNYFVPLDPVTLDTLPEPDRVRAEFQVSMPAWGEFVADSISMTPFAIAGAEDVKWRVENMMLDFSESMTPNTLQVPTNYHSPFVSQTGQVSPLWKGFYLERLSATLPRSLTGEVPNPDDPNNTNCPAGSTIPSSDGSITIAVEDVIIDDMGFTGVASVSPILDINQGNLGGWAISIDTFKIGVVANRLAGAGFSGKIHVPILSGSSENSECVTIEDCLDYRAMVMPGNEYHFAVFAGKDYHLPLWKAGIQIDSTSYVGVSIIDNEFIATANLNGAVFFDSDIPIKMDTVSFEGLQVSNKNPHFSPGTWGVPTSIGAEFSGFGISLEDIKVKETDTEGEIAFDWKTIIKLTEGVDLTGAAGFAAIGYMDDSSGRQRWRFKKFEVNTILVDGSFPGVESIYGLVDFFDEHPTFGKGFRGILSTKFSGGMTVGLDAVAVFGAIEEPTPYKYFMVDALATFDPGISMGGLQLLGFGGGVYQHMKRESSGIVLSTTPTQSSPTLPGLGASLSGVVYTPDKSVNLGLKASVVIATANKNIFNGNASFEIVFNDGGGLSTIAFVGNARFLDYPQLQADNNGGVGKPNNGAPINAFINIAYDNGNKTFDATFDVYVNVLNILKGTGADDKFSSTVLHVGPDAWFINMGTPANPNGLKLTVPGIGDLLELKSYIDVGTNIPPMPPLPSHVAFMTGSGNFVANESLRATGKGLAFGASFMMGTGDITFLVFYANFQVGGGFDVMLQDYGEAICAETGDPIGINGWYASGQAWAYVQGDVGIRVKVFGSYKKFKILSIGAGAALQAKLPNPFWARGSVGGYYNILGGLVKGNCNFEMTIGESCTILGADDPVENLEVISQIIPTDGANIEVFSEPNVQFNLPLDKVFEITDLDGNQQAYTAGVKEVNCLHSNGSNIPGTTSYNYDKTSMFFTPFDMFPANDSITFEVVAFIKQGSTEIKEETWTVKYYTGEGLTNIPESNVLATYPVKGQYNFYKEEWSQEKGYILLRTGQPDLFYNVPDGYSQRIKISKGSQAVLLVTPEYDAYKKEVSFPLPSVLLDNNEPYTIQLVNLPASSGNNTTNLPTNAQASPVANMLGNPNTNAPNSSTTNSSTPITSNSMGNNFQSSAGSPVVDDNNTGGNALGPAVLYKWYFRTSKYNTFGEKLDDIQASYSISGTIGSFTVGFNTEDEPFDVFETGTSQTNEPLVHAEVIDNSNAYFNSIESKLYDYFPGQIDENGGDLYFESEIRNRPFFGGNPIPFDAINLRAKQSVELSSLYAAAGILPTFNNTNSSIAFTMPNYVNNDYDDFRAQLEEQIGGSVFQNLNDEFGPNPLPYWVNYILDYEDLPPVNNGTYQFQLRYKLPGKTTFSTTRVLNFVK